MPKTKRCGTCQHWTRARGEKKIGLCATLQTFTWIKDGSACVDHAKKPKEADHAKE